MATFELFVFRHGETDWNRELRFQGHTDIPLNADGVLQAQELASTLERCQIQVLLTSDLQRARRTAEIVNAASQVPVHESSALRECHLGDAEGVFRDQVLAIHGQDAWERWRSNKPEDHDYGFPNGETKRTHRTRLIHYLENFCNTHTDYQRIGVSTHGGSLRQIVHHCANAPEEPIAIPNCVLYKVSLSEENWVFQGRVE